MKLKQRFTDFLCKIELHKTIITYKVDFYTQNVVTVYYYKQCIRCNFNTLIDTKYITNKQHDKMLKNGNYGKQSYKTSKLIDASQAIAILDVTKVISNDIRKGGQI